MTVTIPSPNITRAPRPTQCHRQPAASVLSHPTTSPHPSPLRHATRHPNRVQSHKHSLEATLLSRLARAVQKGSVPGTSDQRPCSSAAPQPLDAPAQPLNMASSEPPRHTPRATHPRLASNRDGNEKLSTGGAAAWGRAAGGESARARRAQTTRRDTRTLLWIFCRPSTTRPR